MISLVLTSDELLALDNALEFCELSRVEEENTYDFARLRVKVARVIAEQENNDGR